MFEKTTALQCSSGLFKLMFNVLDRLVDDLEKFRSLSFMHVEPLE